MNWDDLRFVLSVSRAQTLTGAALALGVNQTTVARRLQAIESVLGTRLFDRVDQRWVPTAAGVIAVHRAERMDAEAVKTAKEIAGRDKSLAGKVRLTSVPSIINSLLTPRLEDLFRNYPDLELELIDSPKNLDLAHLEADLAIRLGRPTLQSAVVRRLGTLKLHVYVREQDADRADELPWVGVLESKQSLPEAEWISNEMGGDPPIIRTSDSNMTLSVVSSMPCRAILAESRVPANSGLINVSGPDPIITRAVWLVYMEAMRKNALVSAVASWAAQACSVLR